MTSTTANDTSALLNGPGDPGYDSAIATFNTDAHLNPAFAVTTNTRDEVAEAIHEATLLGLGVRTQSTGHAAKTTGPMRRDILIRTRMDGDVLVDPIAHTATIPAGTLWGAVVEAAAPHGLVAIHGSSPTVGAIGFLLRGGLSFYGRHFGISANSLLSITLTLATGESVTASERHLPDLFWALRGGGGGFGVVTEVTIQLFPVTEIITGAVFWPASAAATVAPLWRRWTESAPIAATTNLRVMNLPPLPGIPPMLTAGPVLVLDGAILVEDPTSAGVSQKMHDDLLEPLLKSATPLLNTWARAHPSTLPMTHMDPREPIPGIGDHLLLRDLDDEALLHIVSLAASDTTLAVFELRQMGGRFAVPEVDGGAFDRTSAKFLYLGAGAVFDEEARKQIDARLVVFRDYLEKWNTGYTAPTFVENFAGPQRTLDDKANSRVVRIRALFDPTGIFAGDVSPVRD
jgi:hypothetical protein